MQLCMCCQSHCQTLVVSSTEVIMLGEKLEVFYLNKSIQPDLVGLHLLLSRFMFLQLPEDVCGVSVGLVFCHLKLLLHPQQQLIRISLELLPHETPGKFTLIFIIKELITFI